MQGPELKRLIDERAALLAELTELRHMLHGSWLERYLTCVRPACRVEPGAGRPECRCHQGERHGPRSYVPVNGKRMENADLP